MVTEVSNQGAGFSTYLKKSAGLDADDFMKLFITQLKHQDPMRPQDAGAILGQMAQLTQVEQAYAMNRNIEQLSSALGQGDAYGAIALMGRNVVVRSDTFTLAEGGTPLLPFRLEQNAQQVELQVTDEAGTVVRTLRLGSAAAGEKSARWDGTSETGKRLPPGRYRFSVVARGADGSTAPATPLLRGTVSGVRLEGGKPAVVVDGTEVPVAQIVEVG